MSREKEKKRRDGLTKKKYGCNLRNRKKEVEGREVNNGFLNTKIDQHLRK